MQAKIWAGKEIRTVQLFCDSIRHVATTKILWKFTNFSPKPGWAPIYFLIGLPDARSEHVAVVLGVKFIISVCNKLPCKSCSLINIFDLPTSVLVFYNLVYFARFIITFHNASKITSLVISAKVSPACVI